MAYHSSSVRHAGPLLLPVVLLLVRSATAAAIPPASPSPNPSPSSLPSPSRSSSPSPSPSTSHSSDDASVSGVPDLELAKWNQAYKVTVANITERQLNRSLPGWYKCTEEGYERPTAANLSSCAFKKHENGTVTAWRKMAGDRRTASNCYCYALNTFKGGRCNPGSANGTDKFIAKSDTKTTCDLMNQALVADVAVPVSREAAMTGQPEKGHYIAVMVSTDGCNPYHCWNNDYHAARKDSNGLWSWKEPTGPATNKNLFGDLFKNPESPNVTVHYDVFCGYYNVVPSEMTIDAETSGDDMSIEDRVKYYRGGLDDAVVWAEPLPYNETTDGAYDASSERLMQQDRLWESKRGSKE